MEARLEANERIDDLLTEDLRIIQSDEVFCFSLDAVLLARFCTVPPRGRVADLCTGNGVIPLLLTTRTRASIVGVELQERIADMARRNVALNRLEEHIAVVQEDIRTFSADESEHGRFDLVTVNPPYLPVSGGMANLNPYQAMARHEIGCSLQEVLQAAARLVRFGGKVAMVHRPSRLAEIIAGMQAVRLEPKRLRFVHPRLHQEANMVLIEAALGGRPEVRLLPPLVVYREGNVYTDELLEIFYGQSR